MMTDPYRGSEEKDHVTITRYEYERLLRSDELWDRIEEIDYVSMHFGPPWRKKWKVSWLRTDGHDSVGSKLREVVERHLKLPPLPCTSRRPNLSKVVMWLQGRKT